MFSGCHHHHLYQLDWQAGVGRHCVSAVVSSHRLRRLAESAYKDCRHGRIESARSGTQIPLHRWHQRKLLQPAD